MKLIIILFVILINTEMLYAQDGYHVMGKVTAPDGKLYLITPTIQGNDTLGVTDLVNGHFSFTGKVDAPCVAFVQTADGAGRFPLMLENTTFQIQMVQGGLSIQGGKFQQMYNDFTRMNRELSLELKKMQTEYQTAAGTNNAMRMQALQGQMQKFAKEKQGEINVWMKENSDTYVMAFVLAPMANKMKYAELKALYETLGPNARSSFYGQAIAARLQLIRKAEVGDVAPAFEAETPEGQSLSLSDVKGKVKLVDFWASWCRPCREENKNVVALYKKFHKKGLEIIGVSMDTKADSWKKAIKEDKLVWNHVSDLKGMKGSSIAKAYGVSAIPSTFLLDENNRIIAKGLRGKALEEKIDEVLQGK